MLETKPGSSVKAANALNHRTISPAFLFHMANGSSSFLKAPKNEAYNGLLPLQPCPLNTSNFLLLLFTFVFFMISLSQESFLEVSIFLG